MTYLKLYHKETFIGTITDIVCEGANLKSGKIRLSKDSIKYEHIFAYMLDMEGMASGYSLPFSEAIFDDWFFEDEQANRKRTIIPGIYPHGDIIWTE